MTYGQSLNFFQWVFVFEWRQSCNILYYSHFKSYIYIYMYIQIQIYIIPNAHMFSCFNLLSSYSCYLKFVSALQIIGVQYAVTKMFMTALMRDMTLHPTTTTTTSPRVQVYLSLPSHELCLFIQTVGELCLLFRGWTKCL